MQQAELLRQQRREEQEALKKKRQFTWNQKVRGGLHRAHWQASALAGERMLFAVRVSGRSRCGMTATMPRGRRMGCRPAVAICSTCQPCGCCCSVSLQEKRKRDEVKGSRVLCL